MFLKKIIGIFLLFLISNFIIADEPEKNYLHLLNEAKTQFGEDSEQVNDRRQRLIEYYEDNKQLRKAVAHIKRVLAYHETLDDPLLEDSTRYRLGRVLRKIGKFSAAEQHLRNVYEFRFKRYGKEHRRTISVMMQLGLNIAWLGQNKESISLLKEVVAYREKHDVFGSNKKAWAYDFLGTAYYRNGQYQKAIDLYKKAHKMFKKNNEPSYVGSKVTLMQLGRLYNKIGRLAEAEKVLQKGFVNMLADGLSNDPYTASLLMHLGDTMRDQARYSEAEKIQKRAVEILEKQLGKDNSRTSYGLFKLAKTYFLNKNYGEAEVALRRILHAKPTAEMKARVYTRLAGALVEQKKYDGVIKMLDEALDYFINNQPNHLGVPELHEQYGNYYILRKDFLNAIKHFEMAAVGYDRLRGSVDPATARALSLLANGQAGAGDFDAAVESYRRTLNVVSKFLSGRRNQSPAARAEQERNVREMLLHYLDLLLKAGNKNPAEYLESEAFTVAEMARSRALQNVLLGMTARAAAKNTKLADLVRAEQDLKLRIGVIEDEFFSALGNFENKQDNTQTTRISAERELRVSELERISSQLEIEYPEYTDLINPTPTKLSEVKRLLIPGELMLAYFVQKDRTLIWAIDKNKTKLHVSKLTEKEIHTRIQRIRTSLDVPVATIEDIPSYDIKLAHELYKELVAPMGSQLQNAKSLIIVPHKALLSMPFGALVTAKASKKKGGLPFSEYKSVPWLAKKYAINIIPSATALVTMRTYAKKKKADEPFIGFGDPVFGEDEGVVDVVKSRGVRIAQRAAFNTRSINGLPNLPETKEELKQIALSLGASNENIYLGNKANEKNVKNANLKDFRVVAFATHGLVADDLDGLEQPALALTPPQKADEVNDGLLQMDEVLGLELNADWVVLSACNTASGDKSLANEGLTGLTQAFFYAGSRALLVSLWPVESTSTQQLTTALFSAAIKDKTLGRAASLQAARKRLIDGQGYSYEGKEIFSYSHPIFWAAFIAVGEGGIN